MTDGIANGQIHYDATGAGVPVVFLHAFPLNRRMWDEQVGALPPGHSAVRFDARGFGQTAPGDGLLTMERIADDAALVLDALGAGPAVVCGLSMGGYAALAMMRRHPRKVRALVLADTRCGPDTPAARQTRAEQAERVLKEGAVFMADTFLQKLVGETTHRERPLVVARLREMIVAAPPRGIANALAGLAARADSCATLREIRVPTLVLCGAEDTLTPVAEAQRLQAGIAGSILEVIPAAGHLSNVESPGAFNAALGRFLSGL